MSRDAAGGAGPGGLMGSSCREDPCREGSCRARETRDFADPATALARSGMMSWRLVRRTACGYVGAGSRGLPACRHVGTV